MKTKDEPTIKNFKPTAELIRGAVAASSTPADDFWTRLSALTEADERNQEGPAIKPRHVRR